MRSCTVPALCLALVLPLTASAQRHAIQAGLDTAFQAERDDMLVPLAHSELRLALAPRYFGDTKFALWLADGRFGVGYGAGRYGEQAATFTWGLHASPQFLVSEEATHGLSFGPALGWENETFLFGDWDDAHAYWIGALWFGPRMHDFRFDGAPTNTPIATFSPPPSR